MEKRYYINHALVTPEEWQQEREKRQHKIVTETIETFDSYIKSYFLIPKTSVIHFQRRRISNEALKKMEAELERKKLYIQDQIIKNLEIIREVKRSSRGKQGSRRMFAIYRLYKSLNLSPKEIAKLTGLSRSSIQLTIGNTFARLCQKNKCVFEKYLWKRRK